MTAAARSAHMVRTMHNGMHGLLESGLLHPQRKCEVHRARGSEVRDDCENYPMMDDFLVHLEEDNDGKACCGWLSPLQRQRAVKRRTAVRCGETPVRTNTPQCTFRTGRSEMANKQVQESGKAYRADNGRADAVLVLHALQQAQIWHQPEANPVQEHYRRGGRRHLARTRWRAVPVRDLSSLRVDKASLRQPYPAHRVCRISGQA